MDERSRPGTQPRTTGPAEIIGYGLLATAVAAGVLYLDGQRPRDIAIIAAAILALLVTLVLIAPRLGEPEKQDTSVTHAGRARPDGHDDEAPAPGHQPPGRAPGAEPSLERPSGPAPRGDASSPDSDGSAPAGQAKPGRRAKRGRRRR